MNRNNNYISVIVSAYDRKKYLLEALKSVTDQALPRDKYEIILIKNFNDEIIDKFAEQNNIHNLYSEDKTLSGKIFAGITVVKGDIICFLDDDDVFYPNKLTYVHQKFLDDEKLCYLHNKFTAIDENGRLIAYYNDNPDFNMSSISVKKEIIDVESLTKVTKSIDTLMYLFALESGMPIELDSETLTYYRVSGESVTHAFNDIDSFRKFSYNSLNNILNSYVQMLSIFHSQKVQKILKHKISFTKIRLHLFGGNRVKLRDYLNILVSPTLESRTYEIKVAVASLFMKKYTVDKLYKNEKAKQKYA
jgi:glycosyltransferase involved in cell wall biosynthesis